ncbi:MAG: hypothetical protein ABI233_11205 [Chthoniobacterales bacterium]
MRAPDLNDGTLKAVLILILLGANIAPGLPGETARVPTPGSARVSRAGFWRLAKTNFLFGCCRPAKFATARTPLPARETRALPAAKTLAKETYVARP